MRKIKSNKLLKSINDLMIDLPTPANISYLWNFGSLLAVVLGSQIITGVILAMHYVANINLAFESVEHIMRDIRYGWLVRYIHSNGASIFFILVYLHIGRGIYYGSYRRPRILLWITGTIIILTMILTAFIGYVLPWGQMSYWAATVITNMISAIPYIGDEIVKWVWGGFSVNNATLNRFYSIHYLLPFIISGLAIIHVITLHEEGSNNPLGINSNIDKIPFHPYYTSKDGLGILILILGLIGVISYYPNVMGHSDNYIEANSLVTPEHIVPEFYFLFAYGILRSIPNKEIGVIGLMSSIIILAGLPWLDRSIIRSNTHKPLMRWSFWLFIGTFLILSWIGGKPVESPYDEIGKVFTIIYFMYFLVIVPICSTIENEIVYKGA